MSFAGLEVVLGLIFVYLILSLVCTGINETVASVFAWRPRLLREGVRSLLDDPQGVGVAKAVENHPLIQSLVRSRRREPRPWKRRTLSRFVAWWRDGRYPSYLPSRQFVTALLDVAQKNPHLLEKEGKPTPLSEVVGVLSRGAADIDEQRRRLETWYDDGMERVSGWYRRRVQLFMWAWALVVVVAVNADSLQIARTLWRDDTVRAVVVARAEEAVAAGEPATPGNIRQVASTVKTLEPLNIPIGWRGGWSWSELPLRIPGWLVTAFAITLGAPFWFDLLSKVARIRSAGAAPPSRAAAAPGEGKRDEEGRRVVA